MSNTKGFKPLQLTKYKKGDIFAGSIVCVMSESKRLVYCVDSQSVKTFKAINSYKYREEYSKLPREKSKFIYYSKSRNTFYRCFRPADNPNSPFIKATLVDTGETTYLKYQPGKFFQIPKEFAAIPSMALLCKIDTFPEEFDSFSNFIAKNISSPGRPAVRVKFRVNMIINNVSLLVDVLESSFNLLQGSLMSCSSGMKEESKTGMTDSNVQKFSMPLKPSTSAFDYPSTPIMANVIPTNRDVPEVNSRVLVYPGIILRPDLMYGQCKKLEQCAKSNPTLEALVNKMNRAREKYVQLKSKPMLKEMVVITDETRKNFYRGLVHEIFDDVCMILYVDYGWIQTKNYRDLYKFPSEFASCPFQAYRIYATNIEVSTEANVNASRVQIIQKNLSPFGIGVVEHIDGFNIALRLFNNKAVDMNAVLASYAFLE